MDAVQRIINGVRKENRNILLETEAKDILKEYGISVVEGSVATNGEEAALHAERLGFPVVLKIVSPQITHKSDSGGVKLNLSNTGEVKRAYQEIMSAVGNNNPEAEIKGVLVQPMAPPGRELVVGAMQDPLFGPVVMFGLGGIFVEVLEDVAFRLAPVDQAEAKEMVQQIKGYAVLKGIRGQTSCDIDAIVETIVKVSKLIYEQKEALAEIDINPMFAYSKGAIAVDARIVLNS